MPIYEYEPVDHDCMMCPNRMQAIQSIGEAALVFCPDCGMAVKRVVSQASIKISSGGSASEAARRGFTTWKKAGQNTWEKLDGPGADVIIGDPRDVAQMKEEAKPKKTLDLDQP